MGPELASCRFLHACIDEALRMSPPVGSALFREVVAPGGAVIDGHPVPQGADVGVGIYAIHHSPECYGPDPFVYRPDRWLVDDGHGSIESARAAFNPLLHRHARLPGQGPGPDRDDAHPGCHVRRRRLRPTRR